VRRLPRCGDGSVTDLVDATVLSNFAAVGRLDLLRVALGAAYLTDAVYEELRAGAEAGYAFLTAIEQHMALFDAQGWLHLAAIEGEVEQQLLRSLPSSLHHGEATSLAIAQVRGWRFLTDDRLARAAAVRLGVGVGGTLGMLVRLVELDLITQAEANRLLNEMIARAGYRAPVSDLSQLDAE
jgi:predicted nucleic acid-binding protein